MPVYDVHMPRLRTEAASVAPWAPRRAEYFDGTSYASDSSRNLTYPASLIVKSRSGPPLKYWASSLGSVFCGCTYSMQVWKSWQRIRMLLSSRLKPDAASSIADRRQL